MKEKAISVKQPWAYLLCANIKPIENRTWKLPEKYIGERVFIHASAKPANIELEIPNQATEHEIKLLTTLNFCDENDFYSAIIDYVEFSDCVINHPSIWAEKSNYIPKSLVDSKIHNTKEWIPDVDGNVVYKKDVIYNWVVSEAVLFDKPILNVKGKLSFWYCSEYLLR